MIKKILVALAMIASTVLIAAPAQADLSGCVSAAEYDQVHLEMRQSRVHNIFGQSGLVTSTWSSGGWRYQERVYDFCSDGDLFTLTYGDYGDVWRLVGW